MTHPATPFPADTRIADVPERTGDRLSYEDYADDNNLRACWAAVGVRPYAKRVGTVGAEDAETILGDFLADLHHLADALGVDWTALLEQASFHYYEEKAGRL